MASLRVVSLIVLTSCGSLIDDRYLGPIQLHFGGDVQGGPMALDRHMGKARVALFYFPNGPRNADTIDDLIEDESTGLNLNVAMGLDWKIYDLPDERHFTVTPSGKRYALGVPYVYVDDNGNGRREPGERFAGEAPVIGVFFAPDEVPASESPTGRTLLAPVMAVSARPFWCEERPAEPPEDQRGDCGVPLGAMCASDVECGAGGRCLKSEPWPWPRGYCALPSESTCTPRKAHLWRSHKTEPPMPPLPPKLPMYWLPACESDRDCPGQPYRCDIASSVCLPNANLALRVDVVSPLAVCQPPPPP